MITPIDIFYKVRARTESYDSFPAPSASMDTNSKSIVIVRFKGTDIILLVKSLYDSMGTTICKESELERHVSALGEPLDLAMTEVYIDQTPEEISSDSVLVDKIQLQFVPNDPLKIDQILNAIDTAYHYAMGANNVRRSVRTA
jgi:hypothetical protein